jgi:PAS domain S-box-containing protein
MGQPVIVPDLADDPRCHDLALIERGFTSALVSPLVHPQGTFGAVGLYCRQPREFACADVFFLESVTNLAAVAFARQAAEEAAARQRKRMAGLLPSDETSTLELTADARIEHCNQTMERLSGFSLSEIRQRSIYSAFILPEELENVREALEKAREQDDCVRVECFLLTKDGSRRRVFWSITRSIGDDDQVTGFTADGIDMTEQYEVAERLRRAEAVADNAVQTLRALRERGTGEPSAAAQREGRLSARRDRRCLTRRSFPYQQCIAPIFHGQIPTQDSFREVRCKDLSASGFSFESASIPDYRHLLIAFGKGGDLIYLTAEIVHVTPVRQVGEDQYLVGCRYTGRGPEMTF